MSDESFDTATDDVRAAISQLQNGDVAPQEEQQELPLEAEPEGDKQERARDGRGRFIVPPKAKEPAEPDEPELPTKDAKEGPPAAPQQAAVKPPPSWLAEAKVEWSKLSPAVQQAVLKREDETSRGFAQKSEELKRWQALEGIIAPRRDYYQRFGFQNDVQAINHLLTISDSLERDPASTLQFLAKHYGVSLQSNGAQPQGAQPQQFQQQQQPVDVRSAIREEIGLANAASEIESFASNDQYPHFQTVRPMMAHLLQSGGASTLEEAYEAAVWSNPQLRQQMMEQQAAEKAKQDEAARAKMVAKKAAASASLSGAPHGASPAAKKTNGSAGNHFDDAVADVRAAIASLN